MNGYKICSYKDCQYKGEPQPVENFYGDRTQKDGLTSFCKKCNSLKNKKRYHYRKGLNSIKDQFERDTTIACLYINSLESIKQLAKIFKLREIDIENILKEQDVFEHYVCRECLKLLHKSNYSICVNVKSAKGIQSYCKTCVSKQHRAWYKEPCKYSIYSPKIEKFETTRCSEKDILEVKCNYCGDWYKPIRGSVDLRVNTIMGYEQKRFSENRLYCSDKCKNTCPIYGKTPEQLIREDLFRSGQLTHQDLNREVQPELRRMVFERDNYTCQKCNNHKDELNCGIHAHHNEGIRWEPIESADIDRCITYCEDCHKLVHQIPGCQRHEMRCDADEINV